MAIPDNIKLQITGLRLAFTDQDSPIVSPAGVQSGHHIPVLFLCNTEHCPVVVVGAEIVIPADVVLVVPGGGKEVGIAHCGYGRGLGILSDIPSGICSGISSMGSDIEYRRRLKPFNLIRRHPVNDDIHRLACFCRQAQKQ